MSDGNYFFACLIIIFSLPASATNVGNGNFWYSYCTEQNESNCIAFVAGVDQGIGAIAEVLGEMKNADGLYFYCRPEDVTYLQMKDVFVTFLKNNPDNRHSPASLLAMRSWQLAWPCPASSK